MKSIFVMVFSILFCVGTGNAALQTAAPYTQNVPGGVTISDPHVAVTNYSFDLTNQAITVYFNYGTATIVGPNTTAFAADSKAPGTYVYFNAITGAYTTNTPGGSPGGTLTPTEIATLLGVMTGSSTVVQLQNMAEKFAVAHNLYGAGATEYPW